MKYGLSEKQLKEITDILASYEAVEKAILFGSRAIDTYKEASDVDIAIKGENADWSLAMTIKDHLEEETYLPFFFDVVAYESDRALVTLKSFARDGGFRHDGFKEYTGKFKVSHIVNIGDIAVAHTDITQDAALIGNPIFIENPDKYKTLLISMDLAKVNLKSDSILKIFIYFLMRTRLFKSHCVGYSNGSTVLHLNKQTIPSFEFFLPPKELIYSFSIKAENLIQKKNKNQKQIRTLQSLRDTLLPKLMSGEVRVQYDKEVK